ncbi:MAG TPA: hypothetical protein VJA21_11340 [Verrucomicrobiae bacterium]
MKLIIILALAGLVWLAWVWTRRPSPKRTTARTWPPGRGKAGLKPRVAPRV